MSTGLIIYHINQVCALWAMLDHVHLQQETANNIVWKLAANGIYSAASAEGSVTILIKHALFYKWVPQVEVFFMTCHQEYDFRLPSLERRGCPN